MNKVWVAADGKRFMKRITRTTFRKRKTKLSVRNHISINVILKPNHYGYKAFIGPGMYKNFGTLRTDQWILIVMTLLQYEFLLHCITAILF